MSYGNYTVFEPGVRPNGTRTDLRRVAPVRRRGGHMTVAAYRKQLTEAGMRQAITEAVERQGGRVWFVSDSRYAPGTVDLPDLIVALPGRVAFVELKSQRRRITDGQRAALDLLGQATRADVFVVRPEPKDETETSYESFLAWLEGC